MASNEQLSRLDRTLNWTLNHNYTDVAYLQAWRPPVQDPTTRVIPKGAATNRNGSVDGNEPE